MDSNSPSKPGDKHDKNKGISFIRKQLYRPIRFITHVDAYEIVTWFVAALTIGFFILFVALTSLLGCIITGILLIGEAAFVVHLKRKQTTDRPDLAVKRAILKLAPNVKPEIIMHITNHGTRTAYNCTFDCFIAVWTNNFEGPLANECVGVAKCGYPDAVRGATFSAILKIDKPIDAKLFAGITTKAVRLFAYAKGNYTDEGGRHLFLLERCYVYEPDYNTLVIAEDRFWPKESDQN